MRCIARGRSTRASTATTRLREPRDDDRKATRYGGFLSVFATATPARARNASVRRASERAASLAVRYCYAAAARVTDAWLRRPAIFRPLRFSVTGQRVVIEVHERIIGLTIC